MKYLGLITTIVVLLVSSSCSTTTRMSSSVSLGMSQKQVVKICGQPYKQTARYDKEGNMQEIYFYKEKTWDDGGWSWSTTTANHIFVFKNGLLIVIDQGAEEHNKQTYNTHFVF